MKSSRSRLPWWLAAMLLAFYGLIIGMNMCAVAGGSDSSGYMNHARYLASGGQVVAPRVVQGIPYQQNEFLYTPLGFKPALKQDGFVPSYPVGLSLLFLAAHWVSGWSNAGDLVILVHALAGLCATYLLGRQVGLGRWWALAGTIIIAVSPLYLVMSLQAMSDVPSLFWTTLAVLAALRSEESLGWASLAGLSLGVDVLLRPTNLLAVLPAGIALGASPKRWATFVAAGIPCAAYLLQHSASLYGSAFATGYGQVNLFFASLVPGTLAHYAKWLPVLFTPSVVLVFGLPWSRDSSARVRWVLLTWVLVFGIFYSSYAYTHETWWYLRFLLPAVSPMVVGGLLVLRGMPFLGPALGRHPRFVFMASVSILILNTAWWCRDLSVFDVGRAQRQYVDVCQWMRHNLPKNAVCAALEMTGSLEYYTGFTFIRHDALHEDNRSRIEAALKSSGRPLYAVLYPYELYDRHALQEEMPGHWIKVDQLGDVTVWRREFDTVETILEVPPYEAGWDVESPADLRRNPADGRIVSLAYGPDSWNGVETWRNPDGRMEYWRWSSGKGIVTIKNPHSFALGARIRFGLSSNGLRWVNVSRGATTLWRGQVKPANQNQTTIDDVVLPPGISEIDFESEQPPVYASETDRRLVAFAVRNLTLEVLDRR